MDVNGRMFVLGLLLLSATTVTCSNCGAGAGGATKCCGSNVGGGPSRDLLVQCTYNGIRYSGYQSNCCCCGTDNIAQITEPDSSNDANIFKTKWSNVCTNVAYFNDGKNSNGNLFWCQPQTTGPSSTAPPITTAPPTTDPAGGGAVKGDPHFSGFDGTEFDIKGKTGLFYNLLTDTYHSINAKFAQVQPVLVENLWITEVGIVLPQNNTLTLKLQLDNYTAEFQEAYEGYDRMQRMGYSSIKSIVKVEINGNDASDMLESQSYLYPHEKEVLVYFPADKHNNDPTDGPLVVVHTPQFEIQVLLETEGVLHLDLSIRILRQDQGGLHGLIGQTAYWSAAKANNYIQGSEDNYVVSSLLDTEYTFSRFGKKEFRRLLRAGTGSVLDSPVGSMAGSIHV